jgi:hypothetical protein
MLYKFKFYSPAPNTPEKYKAIKEITVDVNGQGLDEFAKDNYRYVNVVISRK